MIELTYILYHSIIAIWLIHFAWHDIKTQRVEPKARLLFLPFALLSLFPNTFIHQNFMIALIDSLAGSIGAFLFLFLIGWVTTKKGRPAIGGGDIKLMAYIGFIYGITNLPFLFLTLAIVMLIGSVYLLIRKKSLTCPAVPFIAIACFVCSVVNYLKI